MRHHTSIAVHLSMYVRMRHYLWDVDCGLLLVDAVQPRILLLALLVPDVVTILIEVPTCASVRVASAAVQTQPTPRATPHPG